MKLRGYLDKLWTCDGFAPEYPDAPVPRAAKAQRYWADQIAGWKKHYRASDRVERQCRLAAAAARAKANWWMHTENDDVYRRFVRAWYAFDKADPDWVTKPKSWYRDGWNTGL